MFLNIYLYRRDIDYDESVAARLTTCIDIFIYQQSWARHNCFASRQRQRNNVI